MSRRGESMATPEELRRLAGPTPSRWEILRQEREERREDRLAYRGYLARQAAAREQAVRQDWQEARVVADAAGATLEEAARRREHSALINVSDPSQARKVANILSDQGYRVRSGSSEGLVTYISDDKYQDTEYWVRVKW
jgi:hypothetical protein